MSVAISLLVSHKDVCPSKSLNDNYLVPRENE
jgi:hypothetical protein